MPLHPLAQAYLDQLAAIGYVPVNQLSVEAARQQSINLIPLQGDPQPVAHIEDRAVPGPLGPIPVRIYRPSDAAPLPVLVYYHGGGFVLGNLDTTDLTCRWLTNAVGCAVVSVNYRHAPEHKFPAAAEDAYAATAWVAENAALLGLDPQRVAVGGISAGGNLAAVVALMARDRGGPRLVHQTLNVPVINHAFDTRSYAENAEGYGLTMVSMRWFWEHYLSRPEDGQHPYASPLRAPDLSGLPPTHVLTAEYDPLRDEGDAYAARLREAGVPVAHTCYGGMIHSVLGPQAMEDIAAELRRAFEL